jgi:surface protein
MKRFLHKLSGALLLLCLTAGLFTLTSYANPVILYAGTWGTCPWEIDANGKLTVHPGTGVNTYGKSPWADYASQIKSVVFAKEGDAVVVAPPACSHLFNGFGNAASFDFPGWNTAAAESMYGMFHNCSSVTALDLSGWNTAAVIAMYDMFNGCSSLTTLTLEGWNTANVDHMNGMFKNCSSLTSLSFGSAWNTISVTHMKEMFSGCSSLTSLDLSGWNTTNV